MMTLILIISILLTISFTGVAIWRMGELPESISSLVYVFRWKWLWTVWLTLVSLLTCIPAIEALDRIGMGFLGFGTLACLVFCAAMPVFMEDKKEVHDILGISGCVLSQICIWFICPYWLLSWVLFIIIMGGAHILPHSWMGSTFRNKGVFIAEMMCYIGFIGALFST